MARHVNHITEHRPLHNGGVAPRVVVDDDAAELFMLHHIVVEVVAIVGEGDAVSAETFQCGADDFRRDKSFNFFHINDFPCKPIFVST